MYVYSTIWNCFLCDVDHKKVRILTFFLNTHIILFRVHTVLRYSGYILLGVYIYICIGALPFRTGSYLVLPYLARLLDSPEELYEGVQTTVTHYCMRFTHHTNNKPTKSTSKATTTSIKTSPFLCVFMWTIITS
jgi:hypothetical protein